MGYPIYLDGFASLPLAPEAKEAMLSAWMNPGNAGSPNLAGEQAARTIADGRQDVANLIGASPAEITFTSGATEANNLAILGAARAARRDAPNRNRIIVSAVEHKAVLEPALALRSEGFEVAIVPVDTCGRLDMNAFAKLVDEDLLLASVMLVNNETGVVQPVAEAAALAHQSGALFHTDAAQAAGKIEIDVFDLDVDYLTLSAHKCYGPMGIGALYVSAGAPKPSPLVLGGGQQGGMRPGTEPVALIAGFGAAAKVAKDRLAHDGAHCKSLIDLLVQSLQLRQLRFRQVTGDASTVPGSASLQLLGVDADELCARIAPQVSLSTGSACTSGQIKSSHVLESIGLSDLEARGVIRILCNRYQDREEILAAAAYIAEAYALSHLATGEVPQ
ncbi:MULTISPECIES: cysteine desulfurase family protein [Rhizobium]|uniref:cysteine desulfurase family protein n=1 Tax=unclassified Rhizobium TaxID=2613769 RepID=UPI001ADB81E5|nr:MULTISPECIES: cysteine desulfurase family protein [unclassified Rhizobium]MBO9101778.1 cysteine desulfurase [Rhizobium sp. L58/93]MBO9171949.1 cysteine desulfurase [Rhizobium sp. L245/93]MBO9187810.1 cysteine desulfurase [Rhizobium sp. E27B/91]QXZ87757.1 cysteine desulfurase [Rhizobium sp. K1/93]QXZ93796.1 cysteine desulfurase [Rhizobium sp. K15/93]